MGPPDSKQIVGLGYRFGAGLVDLIIFCGACGLLQLTLFNHPHPEPSAVRALALLPMLIWPLCWWAFGRGPGGWMMSSRLVNADGSRLGLFRALWRFVAMWLTLLPLGLGFWSGAWNKQGRTWYDRLSRTRVTGDESFLPPGEVKF